MNAKNAVVFSCTFTPPSPSGRWRTKQKATWASNRRFYSCNAAHNEIDVTEYIADGEKVERPDNELLHKGSTWIYRTVSRTKTRRVI